MESSLGKENLTSVAGKMISTEAGELFFTEEEAAILEGVSTGIEEALRPSVGHSKKILKSVTSVAGRLPLEVSTEIEEAIRLESSLGEDVTSVTGRLPVEVSTEIEEALRQSVDSKKILESSLGEEDVTSLGEEDVTSLGEEDVTSLGEEDVTSLGEEDVTGREIEEAVRPSVEDLEKILKKCFPSPASNIKNLSNHDYNTNYFGLDRPVHHIVYDSKAGRVEKEISKGQSVDVISLLSWGTPSSNVLIRGDGSKVDVNTLQGKYVVVCCVFLPLHYHLHMREAQILAAIFAAAAAADCPFQLVIVPKLRPGFDSHLVIDHFFNSIPSTCLVLPYHCSISCDHACNSLGLSGYRPLAALIVDPTGTVLQRNFDCFYKFGMKAFPFTDQYLSTLYHDNTLLMCRVDHITCETMMSDFLDEVKKGPEVTLHELLLCKPSYRLPLATDEKVSVSVSKLNEGYVGLYICAYGTLIHLLSKIHKKCAGKDPQFNILIIPLAFVEPPTSFLESIRLCLSKYNISSWWLFPYDERVCRRLWTLVYQRPDRLIILPPTGRGLSGEFEGNAVITGFGYDAYPFTRASILERNLKRLRELTLKHLFPKDCNVHFSENHLLNVSLLDDKEVFIFLGPLEYSYYPKMLSFLSKIRQAHPGSALVYVPPNEDAIVNYYPAEMQWLVSRSCFTDVISILYAEGESIASNYDFVSTIVAVKNGRIFSRQAHLHLDESGEFLFSDESLRMEILVELSKTYKYSY